MNYKSQLQTTRKTQPEKVHNYGERPWKLDPHLPPQKNISAHFLARLKTWILYFSYVDLLIVIIKLDKRENNEIINSYNTFSISKYKNSFTS